jgi:hypothetical protein
MRLGRTLLAVTAVGIFALVTSCRDIVAPPPVATISLSDYTADLVPSETALITATPKDGTGTALTRPITWTTSAAAVATVENGLITGHAVGTAVISAQSEGIKADVTVSVDDGGIVTPAGTLIYAMGGQVELDFPSASVTSSSRIVVSQPQLAAASVRLIPGTAVSVRTQARIAQAALLIIKYDPARILGSPEAGLRLYQATSNDWQPVDGSTVDIASKTVRGRISVSGVYGIFAQAKVGSIDVSPQTPALKVGESAPFTAQVKDEDGKILTDRAIAWSSSAPEVLQIDASSGASQAKAPGSATVTATSEGKSASTTVSVSPGAAANIAIVAGDGQKTDTSSAVAIAPSVKVTDQAGFAVEGATVTFAIGVGNGSISPASVATNASGVATADKWTLGNVAGTNSVTATIAGGASVVFTATATQPAPPVAPTPPPPPPPPPTPPAAPPAPPLVPAVIAIFAGDGQSAAPLTAVTVNPAAKVTTAAGLPVPGVTVTFSIRSGGGSVSGETAKTDSLGIATVGKWTLGSGGGNSLFATATGLSGSPLIFIATATTGTPPSSPPAAPPPSSPPSSPPPGTTAGPPVAMAIYAGDGQNAPAFTSVATPPSVKVIDAAGVGVPGIVVTFSIRSGGGSIFGEVATTNSQGVASLGGWTLGVIGGQSLWATRAGLNGSPLMFTAMATASVRIVTFGDSNTDAGWSGTTPTAVATSYVSVDGPRAGPYNHDPTQLAGKIEARWRAVSSVALAAVNHGISGTTTAAGRTSSGAPNAREPVGGVTRFQAEVLGQGYPWNGAESGPGYSGPITRVAAFVPGANDFVYVSMGTNDTNVGIGADQTAADLSWMIDQWVAAGRSADHFILTTLAPKAGQNVAIVLVNQQIRQIAASRGVYMIDLAQRTSDDNGLTWRSSADNVGDQLHYSEAVRDWIASQVVAYLLTKAPH